MAFIRKSKLRHVHGDPCKKDLRHEGLKCPSSAYDGNQLAANSKLLAVCVHAAGGGAFCAFPLSKTGRLDTDSTRVSAHSEAISDISWNPFDDNMLATCSESGSIKLWQIPDTGVLIGNGKLLLEKDYHQKRCVQLLWHPIAKNVLLTVSLEPSLAIWNLETGDSIMLLEDELTSQIFAADFSPDGTKIVTSSKDKKFRIYDARTKELLQEGSGHAGGKPQRIIFLSDDRLFSTGFSNMSKRQYSVWDANDLSKFLMQDALDTSNAVLVPHYLPGLKLLFIYGRGDTVIRYYEICDGAPHIYYIDMFQSKESQRAIGTFPHYAVDTTKNEVVRFYKFAEDKGRGYVESIQFMVPRKSELFQEDLYPDTASNVPALGANEWQNGQNANPNMFSFADKYTKEAKERKAAKSKGGLSGGLGGGLSGGLSSSSSAAKKAESKPAAATQPSRAASEPAKPEPAKSEPAKAVPKQAPAPAAATVDNSKIEKLENELKELKKQLQNQAELTSKVEALEEIVTKNNERIATLESLVQEESDDEEEK